MIIKDRINIPLSWEICHLSEIYTIVGGGTPSTKQPEYWGKGTPWISSADIKSSSQIIFRKYVTDSGIKNSNTNKVSKDTVIVVTRVSLGKVALVQSEMCFSQDVHGLIQNPSLISPRYSLFFLEYHMSFLKFDAQGTTIPGITK